MARAARRARDGDDGKGVFAGGGGGENLCGMADAVRDHVPLLMQLLTNEPAMRDYHMQLITTKCLNTSVMLMLLMLGEHALHHTRQCDVQNVRERFQAAVSASAPQAGEFGDASALRDAVLRPLAPGGRRLHYVMLTDGNMPAPVTASSPGGKQGKYFPGHVFVVEKGAEGYHLYQSFVGKYDLVQHIEHRGGSLLLTERQMALVLEALVRFTASAVWDERCSRDFSLLTHIEPQVFDGLFGGATKRDAVLLCHREVALEKDCSHALRRYVAEKAAALGPASAATPSADDSRVYGDPALYAAAPRGAVPLTVAQVRAGLADLSARLGSKADAPA